MSESPWPLKPLAELFKINGEQTFPAAHPCHEFVHYSIPAWDANGQPLVELGAAIESNKTAIKSESVLVSKLNPRKPRVAVIQRVEQRFCASTEFICYQPKRAAECLSFWGAYFSTGDFSRRLERVAIGSTNSHTRANPKETLSWLVPDPDSAEKEKIAEVFAVLNTTIQQTEAIVEKLKQVKQGLLHDLLTRGIDANGELRPSYEQAPHLYKESPLGRIPKGWKVLPVEECGKIITGSTPPSYAPYAWGDKTPFITPAEVTENGEIVMAERYVSERGHRYVRLLPLQTTLVVCIGSTIGKVGITGTFSCTNQQINAVVPSPAFEPSFLFHTIRQNISQLRAMAGLQAVPIVNKSSFGNLLVTKPGYDEQLEIAKRQSSISKRIEQEDAMLYKLRQQKIGLMNDLLTGRVRVTPLLAQSQ